MLAPEFALPDQNGKIHRLSDYLGQWVVVYFYPKDDTPGCTKEACSFRDNQNELQKQSVVVLGISKDSVASHKKFAIKYHLNFTILSDESRETIQAYNAWGVKKMFGHTSEGTLRKTYLIDPQGEIKKVYEKVNPLHHAEEILADIPNV